VAALLAGDEAAWERLRRALGPLCAQVGRRFELTPDEVEELRADVVHKFLEKDAAKLRTYAFRCRLEQWLGIVVLNRARDLYRAQARAVRRQRQEQALAAAPIEVPGHEQILERLAAEADAQHALAALDPENRRLVELRFRHGFTHEALAALTGLTESAINSRMQRALAAMGRALAAREEGAVRERHGT